MNTSFGKQLKMKYCEIFLFLLLLIMDISTNSQEVICEWEQLINVDILTGYPGIVSPYKPGHVLVFRCTDVNVKMQGQRTIECLSNGKWDHPYPKCEAAEVTCEGEQLINVDILTGHPGTAPPYKPGHVLVFRCTDVNLKMQGQRTTECLSNGKWDHPYPKCEEIRCNVPRDQHVSRLQQYFREDMKLGAKQYYDCESGYRKMVEEATCTRDGWTPKPLCAEMTVSAKCGPPPQLNNADTIDMPKKEYDTGERVEYICFSKYTLNLQHPFTKYLTCQRGEWRGSVKCLEPCTVTKEIMDEKGIDLAYANDQKMFAPHNDHITFRCQTGKFQRIDIALRQKCNDGMMTLPECV